ncbi:MAG: hypothetical protein HWE24_06520 [Oceanospirillaceae bacterium]|nr:hypothetical protein [Oceanospirillaceae bacterium]
MLRLIITLSIVVSATNIKSSEIDLSGFVTFAAGFTDNERLLYQNYDDSLDFSENSLAAIQAYTDLGNGWGVTMQLMARGENDWNLESEWAFISYDSESDWRFLIGRQRVPFYLYSDYLDASIAYHWIRPPEGVYSLAFDQVDGFGASKIFDVSGYDIALQFTAGRNKDSIDELTPDYKDLAAISWSIGNELFTARLIYAVADITIPFEPIQPIVDAWEGYGFEKLSESIEIDGEHGVFKGVGGTVNFMSSNLVFEYTRLDSGDSFLPISDSYYVSWVSNLENGMVHLTVGGDTSAPRLSILDEVPLGQDPNIDNLYSSTYGFLDSFDEDSRFLTIGYKQVYTSNINFKYEITWFEDNLNPSADSTLLEFALVSVF